MQDRPHLDICDTEKIENTSQSEDQFRIPKYKDIFYDKDGGVLCFMLYDQISSESGYGFYRDHELPKNLDQFDNNCYFFDKKKSKLYFVSDGQAEEIKIKDMKNFKKTLKGIMDTSEYEYIRKHLNEEEINTLIVKNSEKNVVKVQGDNNPESGLTPIATHARLFQQNSAHTLKTDKEENKELKKCCKCVLF